MRNEQFEWDLPRSKINNKKRLAKMPDTFYAEYLREFGKYPIKEEVIIYEEFIKMRANFFGKEKKT